MGGRSSSSLSRFAKAKAWRQRGSISQIPYNANRYYNGFRYSRINLKQPNRLIIWFSRALQLLIPRRYHRSSIRYRIQQRNFFRDVNEPVYQVQLQGLKRFFYYFAALFLVPALLILLGAYGFLASSAFYTVTLWYEYKNLSANRIINLAEFTQNKAILKAEEGTTVSGESTGQKILGEKASGYISVFNATAEIKQIKKGTLVTCVSSACNGLVYLTENDVNLGPGSSVNDLRIIASDIGENYNLGINSGKFRIADFNPDNQIVATNIKAISGGTPKRVVRIVSASDLQNLESRALDELKNSLFSKITLDYENSSKYIFLKKTFKVEKIGVEGDKEGAEVSVANLTVRASGSVEAVPKDTISPIIADIKNSMVPEGYYLDEKTVDYSYEIRETNNSSESLIAVEVRGIARVRIDIDGLKNQIAGKSLQESLVILNSIPNITDKKVEYTPEVMPDFLRRVPNNKENIKIRVLASDPSSANPA